PMHTSVHYNGWSGPNPNGYATDRSGPGVHARFESVYVETHLTLADVLAQVDPTPRVLPDLRAAIIAYISASNAETEHAYQLDKAHAFNATTTAPENKTFVAQRLAAGAQMLRDVWYTAWMTSGP